LDAIKAAVKFCDDGGAVVLIKQEAVSNSAVWYPDWHARMTSCRLRLLVISEYTLMLMFPCGHIAKTSRVALLFYVIFAVYVVLFSELVMQSLVVALVLGNWTWTWKCDTCGSHRSVTR